MEALVERVVLDERGELGDQAVIPSRDGVASPRERPNELTETAAVSCAKRKLGEAPGGAATS